MGLNFAGCRKREPDGLSASITVREAIAGAAARLSISEQLGPYALQDATLLLLHVIGLTRAQLLANPNRRVTPDERFRYEAAVQRRLTHEPIQYIVGEQEFFGLTLRVTPAVLIPRPETELLVEAMLDAIDATASVSILDVGTGSGAIAIALAANRPNARILATDISQRALEIATENVARHGLTGRIHMIESDLLSGVELDGPFDAIASNPPYIPFAHGRELHPQVREFEPATALFATGDGLDIYRALIPQARKALAPAGLLGLEIGYRQQPAIADLLSEWEDVRFLPDLQGISRVVLARRA